MYASYYAGMHTDAHYREGSTWGTATMMPQRAVSVWDAGAWRAVPGTYRVLVGPNSRDAALEGAFEVVCAPTEAHLRAPRWYRECRGVPRAEDFNELMGRTVAERAPRKGSDTMADSIEEMRADSLLMRIVYAAIERAIAHGLCVKPGSNDPEFRMQMASSAGASLASMHIAGCLCTYALEGLLEIANGHPLRALRLVLKRSRKLVD